MLDIRTDNLRKQFGAVVAVDDLTITFPAGTTTCLLGPSGCGKTTLMRMIAGLETPTHGDIYFGDQRVTRLSTRARNIGMVFQYPVVYRGSDVRANIELPLRAEKLSKAERDRRVDEVLDLLEMRHAAAADIDALDNGTRQKVAVARAVARQPKIILFDEPITNVDISSKLQLKRALKELVTRLNQTIIYVTHDQTEAMTLADQIALMKDGRIVQYATPRELYDRPNDVFGGWFLGNPGMNFVENFARSISSDGTVNSPLFATPVRLSGRSGEQLTLGIRPEHVRVFAAAQAEAVPARVTNRAIVVGGQYLVTLRIGDLVLKAKVASDTGRALGEEAWVQLPLERITLFGADGHKPDIALQPINLSTSQPPTAAAQRIQP
ncbi:MAG TPA: ABC transporter ATP-binding protein [Chloroflexi bacterium]|nr:ABC transporter ATP-binding protein [Chloroflexota bacterium]HHW84697.1 ABC transporter ATP-binding protein [Chloroflexota bacterium]